MEITTVKIQEQGYLVDSVKSVPEDPKNSEYIAVENWIIGKTHDWLILEQVFIMETAAHDNWLKIQSYDADIAQYNIDLDAYLTWEWTEEEPTRPPMPDPVPKPVGYWTQEEVDDSLAAHTEWLVGYNAWVADTDPLKPTEYWLPEPEILYLPVNVVEPPVTPLPALVPNTPEPQFTLDEYKDNKRAELKVDCNNDIESGFDSNAMGTTYTYESTLKDQINISGAAQANATLEFTAIDGNGDKSRVSHDATQMQQVFTDGVIVMQTKKTTLYGLLTDVDNATNEAEVDAVNWV